MVSLYGSESETRRRWMIVRTVGGTHPCHARSGLPKKKNHRAILSSAGRDRREKNMYQNRTMNTPLADLIDLIHYITITTSRLPSDPISTPPLPNPTPRRSLLGPRSLPSPQRQPRSPPARPPSASPQTPHRPCCSTPAAPAQAPLPRQPPRPHPDDAVPLLRSLR